jgi:hypothetical protein
MPEQDIAAQQEAAAAEHMQEVDSQFQAHQYQQMLVEASERGQEQSMEMGMDVEC